MFFGYLGCTVHRTSNVPQVTFRIGFIERWQPDQLARDLMLGDFKFVFDECGQVLDKSFPQLLNDVTVMRDDGHITDVDNYTP